MIKPDLTLAVLKDLREFNIVIVHPQDQDRDELSGQLRRLGCHYQTFWPTLDVLPAGTDLVLLAVRPETLSTKYPWIDLPFRPPVIPVVISENPITVAAVLRINAFATIASPVRSAGLLTAIAVTLTQYKARRNLERYIDRLEKKQLNTRVIDQATRIVMEKRNLGQTEAYSLLRSQAMLKRESIENTANDIIKAKSLLDF